MKCKNCSATHGCGCQKRIASDGKECCSKCINSYEASLNQSRSNSAPPSTHLGTAPSNASVIIHRKSY